MFSTRSSLYRQIVILMIIIGVITSCASVFQNMDDKLDRKRFKLDYQLYDNALSVYRSGDYEKAKGMFTALSSAGGSQKLKQRARLGEIACRLMLADTQADYTKAVGMWRDFVGSVKDHDTVWNPALLSPLIERRPPENTTLYIETPPPSPPKSASSGVSATQKRANRKMRGEISVLKKKAERTSELQRRLEKVEAENRTLKDKIKALEAIDQNIRKKKTEIAAPSE
jgi:predicted ribosome quality control (RQC) complex YloA/Tae2 family protein